MTIWVIETNIGTAKNPRWELVVGGRFSAFRTKVDAEEAINGHPSFRSVEYARKETDERAKG